MIQGQMMFLSSTALSQSAIINPKRALLSLKEPALGNGRLKVDSVSFRGTSIDVTPESISATALVDYVMERVREMLVSSNDQEMDQAYLHLYESQSDLKSFKDSAVQNLLSGENIPGASEIECMINELKIMRGSVGEELNLLMMVEAWKNLN